MFIAADYQFGEVFWTIVVFFAWFAWIWIAITCFIDIFRRHDIGGLHKAAWVVFIIVVPFLGVLVYLIAQHDEMRDRSMEQAKGQGRDGPVRRDTAGGSASEIAKAKELLDSGAITQAEYDSIKAKALA